MTDLLILMNMWTSTLQTHPQCGRVSSYV